MASMGVLRSWPTADSSWPLALNECTCHLIRSLALNAIAALAHIVAGRSRAGAQPAPACDDDAARAELRQPAWTRRAK